MNPIDKIFLGIFLGGLGFFLIVVTIGYFNELKFKKRRNQCGN